MKQCIECKQYKREWSFWRDGHGLNPRCKECAREREKQRVRNPDERKSKRRNTHVRKYGLTPAVYERLYDAQGGICAIDGCERPIEGIDHDHKTGKVRGLLCSYCNTALGQVKDDVDRLKALIRYLETQEHTQDWRDVPGPLWMLDVA